MKQISLTVICGASMMTTSAVGLLFHYLGYPFDIEYQMICCFVGALLGLKLEIYNIESLHRNNSND